MPRMARSLTALALAALFGLALWFRVSSLESMPYPDADEAFFGVQARRIVSGGPVAWKTQTGLAITPFNTGLLIPLHAAFGPQLWVLRVPAAAAGVLAVLLTYALMARALDRATALIAAGLLAVLPVAILFSRIGYDSSQAPLFGVLALYCALRGRPVGLMLATAACFWVHPTNVFLAPVLSAAAFARGMGDGSAASSGRRWRRAAAVAAVPLGAALVLGLIMINRPQTQATYPAAFRKHDWPGFLVQLDRLLLALGPFPTPEVTLRWHDRAFWALVLAAFAFGSIRLVRARQWDRLALIAGLIASLVGFHLVAGADGIKPYWLSLLRYGLFLVVPTCVALACLVRPLLVEPTDGARALARHLQHAALLAAGFACLLSVKTQWFDRFAGTGESVWTFRTDLVDPFRLALGQLERDIDERAAAAGPRRRPVVVVGSDYWADCPLRYLAPPRLGLLFLNYEDLVYHIEPSYPLPERARRVRDRMEAGAYAVSTEGKDLAYALSLLYPAGRLRAWPGILTIRRLKTPDELAREARGIAEPVASGARVLR